MLQLLPFYHKVIQKRPTCTKKQSYGIGHIYAKQIKPNFAPNRPKVGFQHDLARSVQNVHTACTEVSATKLIQLCANKKLYYVENI